MEKSKTTRQQSMEKIGKRVCKFFKLLEANQVLTENDVIKLLSPASCKAYFDINYPILIQYTSKEQAFINGHRRYYKDIFNFNGKQYLLVNHWFASNKSHFSKWQLSILPIA